MALFNELEQFVEEKIQDARVEYSVHGKYEFKMAAEAALQSVLIFLLKQKGKDETVPEAPNGVQA